MKSLQGYPAFRKQLLIKLHLEKRQAPILTRWRPLPALWAAELEPGERARAAADEPAAKIIPLYFTPAAAGYASPAMGTDYTDYKVDLHSPADFAARIQGDSMEPYIQDNSIVLVKRQKSLQNGEVGLFFVDGDMKCKQYCEDSFGNIHLFSLNRSRADADVTVSASSGVTVLCYGKVILSKRPPLPKM